MARNRASVTGRKPAAPSPLEQAAQEWRAQEEQRRKLQPAGETYAVTLHLMPLHRSDIDRRAEGEVAWKAQPWGDGAQPRRVALNGAMMGRIVQMVRAREWARATRGAKCVRPRSLTSRARAQRWQRAGGGS